MYILEIEEANQKRVLHPYLCWIAGGLGVIVAPKFVATCKHLIPQELFEDGTATKVKRDIDGLEFDGFVRIARSDYDFILIETNDRICEETQAPELQINVKQGARYIITVYFTLNNQI